ncbi:MAG: hypothetical protein LBU06_01860 [Desulfovibrio sp.]|nr:hypothetical protein [Desulfovibrio sp.]
MRHAEPTVLGDDFPAWGLSRQSRFTDPPAASGTDAAARLRDLLLDSDSIEFMVGSRIKEAHLDPSLPRPLENRRDLARRIARVLGKKYLKTVSLRFI